MILLLYPTKFLCLSGSWISYVVYIKFVKLAPAFTFSTATAATNIAFRKRTWQTSQSDPGHGQAERAVDGYVNPDYGSASWTATKQEVRTIHTFILYATDNICFVNVLYWAI